MTGLFLDRPVTERFDARDLLALAWLCEKAAVGCEATGEAGYSAQLRRDASQCRRLALGEVSA